MTKAEILATDVEMLKPSDINELFGVNPQAIRCMIRSGKLPIKYTMSGRAMKICKNSLINYLEWR